LKFRLSLNFQDWKEWVGRTNRAIGLVFVFALSLAAFAALNSAEKKAVKEAQSVANETAGRVKQACGNPSLRFDMDWGPYKELDYTVGGFSRDQAMRHAGERANRVGNAMIAVCSDLKYKEALSHLTQVRLSPNSEERNFRIDFAREGETLQARFGAFGVLSDEDLTAEIRKQFP